MWGWILALQAAGGLELLPLPTVSDQGLGQARHCALVHHTLVHPYLCTHAFPHPHPHTALNQCYPTSQDTAPGDATDGSSYVALRALDPTES